MSKQIKHMAKKIFICEKREAAEQLIFNSLYFGDPKSYTRKTGYYESNNYVFVWCAGHLYKQKAVEDINPQYKLKFSWDNTFDYKMLNLANELEYIPDNKPSKNPKDTMWKIKDQQIKAIQYILKNVDYDEIILAADADDEGERIHSDPIKYNKNLVKKVPITRFWNTGSYKSHAAVEKAFLSRKPVQDVAFKNRLASANARPASDFLVGMIITKLMSDKLGVGLFRCGRVISVILGMIGRREDQIKNFKPKTYWTIKGLLNPDIQFNHFYDDVDLDEQGNEIKVRATKYFTKDEVDEILNKTKAVNYKGVVLKSTKNNTSSSKPKLYSTDDFNSDFMRLYGVALAYSNAHLEWLRTEGYTSYPRTNGVYLKTDNFDDFNTAIKGAKEYYSQILSDIAKTDNDFNYNKLVLDKNNKVFNNKKAETQNHAPLMIEKALANKDIQLFQTNPTHKERKIQLKHLKEAYDLIATRCLIQVLPDDVIQKENLTIEIAGYKFETNAEKMLYEGWRKFDKNATKTSNSELGLNYKDGDPIQLNDVFTVEAQTTCPKPYTEQTILKALMRVNDALTEEYESITDVNEKKERMKRLKMVKKILTNVRGIGTDATREKALEKPFHDKLIELAGKGKNKYIQLTNLGRFQYELLPPYLKSLETTAIWEQKLDDIRNGLATYDDFIQMVQNSISACVDNISKLSIDSTTIIKKYNLETTHGQFGNRKTNEKQLNLIKFIANILNIQVPNDVLTSSVNASKFIETHKDEASKKYNEMKANGTLLRTLTDKQIAFIQNPKTNAPQNIIDLANKKQVTEDEYKMIHQFISEKFNDKSGTRSFSENQMKVLKNDRNQDKLSKKTKALLDSGKTEFTKEEYDVINKDLQKIFSSFKK